MRYLITIILMLVVGTGYCTDMYVTVAGAGAETGGTWADAFGYAEWETDAEGSSANGDIYYVEEGTYTLTSNFSTTSRGGSNTSGKKIIGVKSGTSAEPPTLSDWAYTSARPLITAAAYLWQMGTYWHVSSMSFTGTGNYVADFSGDSVIENCAFDNTSGSNFRSGGASGNRDRWIGCEFQSLNGYGGASSTSTKYLDCYFHDSGAVGCTTVGEETYVSCVFDTSVIGLQSNADSGITIIGCVFYGNTAHGINSYSTAASWIVANNIFDANGVGWEVATTSESSYIDYNIWDNTTDVTNVTKGPNAITADPAMTDPAGQDFTVPAGSNALDAAHKLNTNIGTVGDYVKNIGVDQDDNVAAGGAFGSGWAG
jgi:hypothetical protein